MDKVKLLTVIVIGLLLVNIATLGFIFFSGPKKGREQGKRPMPREIIIEKLHFDSNQIAAYDKTIKAHQRAIENLDREIRNAKNELYKQLNDTQINNQIKDSLLQQISNFQKHIETTHFNHFLEIKQLCHPDQLESYSELTEELSKIFSHPPRPKK